MALGSLIFFGAAPHAAAIGALGASFATAELVNGAFALLHLVWMEAYTRMNVHHALVYFVASNLLSSLFSSLVLKPPPPIWALCCSWRS